MNWYDIRILYLREMRSALRKGSIVIMSIVIPTVLYPLLIWIAYTGFTFVSGQLEILPSRIAVLNLPKGLEGLRRQIENGKPIDWRDTVADVQADVRSGIVDAVIEFIPPEGRPGNDAGSTLRVTYDSSREPGALAERRISEGVARFRTELLTREGVRRGVPPEQIQGFWIDLHSVATSAQMGRFLLGMLLPLMLVVMLGIGALHPAIDSTAGEREHSTWETTMSLATPRINVVIAKYLYVASMALCAGLLNVLAMMVSLRSLLAPMMGEGARQLSFSIPLRALPVAALCVVSLALFVAAGMMILASFARTFKEGQSLIGPFYMLLVFPITLLQSPTLELTPRLASIPVVNMTLVYREALAGTYRWPLIGVAVLSQLVCVAGALLLARAILRHEDFVTGSFGGNLQAFVRKRLLARS